MKIARGTSADMKDITQHRQSLHCEGVLLVEWDPVESEIIYPFEVGADGVIVSLCPDDACRFRNLLRVGS